MGSPTIVATSVRALRGSVMGSPQSTIVFRLRVQAPKVELVQQARSALAEVLPRWFVGELSVENAPPISATQEVLTLLAESIAAIQREFEIAVSKPLKASIQAIDQGNSILYLPSRSIKATKIAIKWSVFFLNRLMSGDQNCDLPHAVNDARQRLKPFAEKSVNSVYILQAAFELAIPILRPIDDVVVLGAGCRSRWLHSLVSDKTPLLGVQFAQAKNITATLLRAAGLPGANHQLVTTQEQAVRAADALGYPVVVKPADADRGAGVAAGLKDAISVGLAFDLAAKVSRNVLVESWEPGHTHRLTVQDGRVIRVVRRIAGGVVGDGAHTIEELVALVQQTPQQQRLASRFGYQPLTLDEEALGLLCEFGLTAQSRPPAGGYIRLRRRDNVNAGGINEELVPDDPSMVHPDNLRLAIEAASVLLLDFAGIDIITTDIARSWLDVGALICEVNARPQMSGINDPLLYQRLLKQLFPNGATIPTELIVVPENPNEQARVKDALLRRRGELAISLSSGLWIDGSLSTRAFRHSFEAAQALLRRRKVTNAVCCMTARDIWQHGLPLPKWDAVKLVTNAEFTPEEAKVLASIKPWLQAAAPAP